MHPSSRQECSHFQSEAHEKRVRDGGLEEIRVLLLEFVSWNCSNKRLKTNKNIAWQLWMQEAPSQSEPTFPQGLWGGICSRLCPASDCSKHSVALAALLQCLPLWSHCLLFFVSLTSLCLFIIKTPVSLFPSGQPRVISFSRHPSYICKVPLSKYDKIHKF